MSKTAAEIAESMHTDILEAFEKIVSDKPEYEGHRQLFTMQELYDIDPTVYLVYRAISAGSPDGDFTPAWFHAEFVANQIGASDVFAHEVQEAVDRMMEMSMSIDGSNGSIAFPIMPIYATWIDENGRKVYFVSPHGVGAAMVAAIMEFSDGVSNE